MTTFANLADRVQNAIADDATVYTQAEIEEWVAEGMRDYSIHFPRLQNTTINCTANDHTYSLPTDFLSMYRVEYPHGEDPPQYLDRRSRAHPDFFGSEGYYDVEHTGGSAASELWISEDPSTGETIEIWYYAYHDISGVSGTTLTIPPHHEHLPVLFAVWKAAVERMLFRVQRPDVTSPVLDGIRRAADLAHAQYQQALAQALKAQAEGRITGPWEMDRFDRVY